MNVAIYMITYDLNGKGKDYTGVHEAIKSASNGTWCHYWESSWMICSSLTVQQVSDKIRPHIDTDDRYIVIEVKNNYQGWLKKEQWEYIRKMFESQGSLY